MKRTPPQESSGSARPDPSGVPASRIGGPATASSPKPGRSAGRTVMLVVAGILPLLIAGGAALAITGINHFEAVLPKIDVGASCLGESCLTDIEPGPCVRDACNFLILGSDSRAGIPEGGPGGSMGSPANITGQRADAIMLVQTDLQNKRTVVLSIPRDLRVEIPGHGIGKINTAFSYRGGANLMVQTVEKLTGMQINHFVYVNFAGFQSLVNALGGVPICIDRPLVDLEYSGLNLPHAGCYNLKGEQALAFVRARHVEGDIIPDFSRIARQQQFTRAVIDKTLSAGSIFHYADIVRAVGEDIVVDKGLNLYDLQDLTMRLSELGQKSVIFRVVPATPQEIDGVAYVVALQPDTRKLLERIREGKDIGALGKEEPNTPLSPATVEVRVLDDRSNGKAEEVAWYLKRSGFIVDPVEPAPSNYDRNTLYWGRQAEGEELVVADYLPSLTVVYDTKKARQQVITVVIGPGFEGLPGF